MSADLPRAEVRDVQALIEMELAGLEPATSWVRSSSSVIRDLPYLQGLHADGDVGIAHWIVVDSCGFSAFQALSAMSA